MERQEKVREGKLQESTSQMPCGGNIQHAIRHPAMLPWVGEVIFLKRFSTKKGIHNTKREQRCTNVAFLLLVEIVFGLILFGGEIGRIFAR